MKPINAITSLLLASSLCATTVMASSIEDVSFHGFDELPPSIMTERNESYGVPTKLFKLLAWREGLTTERAWRNYGSLPSPPWRGGEAGKLGLTLDQSLYVADNGQTPYVASNCFTCHAGVVAGKVVAGLGNAHHEGVAFRETGEKLLRTYDSPIGRAGLNAILDAGERDTLKGYVRFLRTVLLPSIQTVQSRGDIHGPFVIWRQIARFLDPAQGLETAAEGETTELEKLLVGSYPTVDPNPWWHMRYKKRTFWLYDTSRESLATFALNLMDPHPSNTETFPARMELTRRQLEFAASTEPPAYPRDVHAARADRGYRLFHGLDALANGQKLPCKACHGTYAQSGELLTYPERGRIPLATIGTDPAYATWLTKRLRPLYDHFAKSSFVVPDAADYPDTAGYVPPPLAGVWASAPYFHNGSAPTVEAVLNSQSRPRLWKRSVDPYAYDFTKLGLQHELVSSEQLDAMRRLAMLEPNPVGPWHRSMRRVYDTRAYGKANTGHTFGDAMTSEERSAVVEYLRRL